MVVMSQDGSMVCDFNKFIWEVDGNQLRISNGVMSRVFGEYETNYEAMSVLSDLYQSRRLELSYHTL